MKVFHIFIDSEAYETAEHELTARQLLELAKVSPEANYLIELHGKDQKSYQGNPEATVHLHEKAKFVTASLGPTPVS